MTYIEFTAAEVDNAWNQGYEGFLEGEFRDENPYEEDSEFPMYKAWDEGYLTASESASEDFWHCECDECTCGSKDDE